MVNKEFREHDRYSFITNNVFDDSGRVVKEREFTFRTRCAETEEYLKWIFGWLVSRKDNQQLCVEIYKDEHPSDRDKVAVALANLVNTLHGCDKSLVDEVIETLKVINSMEKLNNVSSD